MTSKAKRHLLAEIAQALAGLPDDVGPQVLEFVRALASRGQLAGPQQGSSAEAPRGWSSVAGTLRWSSDPLAWQQQPRSEWPEPVRAGTLATAPRR